MAAQRGSALPGRSPPRALPASPAGPAALNAATIRRTVITLTPSSVALAAYRAIFETPAAYCGRGSPSPASPALPSW